MALPCIYVGTEPLLPLAASSSKAQFLTHKETANPNGFVKEEKSKINTRKSVMAVNE